MEVIGCSRSKFNRPIKKFQVFGERRSGTNFLETLIEKNSYLKKVWLYGWKHGVPAFPVFPAECLFIVVVREPIEWIRALYSAPFEADLKVKKRNFQDFIRLEWEGRFYLKGSNWRRLSYKLEPGVGAGETLQLDRHPITGKQFSNVMEMRNVKLAGHLSFLDRDVNAVVVRYEDVKADQETLTRTIADLFDIEMKPEFSLVTQHQGHRLVREKPAEVLTKVDLDFIRAGLDLKQESRCGYNL